jgi:hypothetical protein
MDEYVIQKEPGYEYLDKLAFENVTYSNIVRYNNIKYAMVDMLRNPPPEFADVIRQHFLIKSEEILATVAKWVEEAPSFSLTGNSTGPRHESAEMEITEPDAEGNMPMLENYDSYDSYLYDNLVEDHNYNTLHIFREHGYEAGLNLVVNELREELQKLRSN